MFCPSRVFSASLINWAMTSATSPGCMIERRILLGRELAPELGGGPAGRDAVDLDAAPRQLVGERRRERDDGRLGRGVGEPARARGDPRGRRHVEDLGRPVVHVADRLATHQQHREDVDGVRLDDVVDVRVEERLRVGVARDVEQDVDAPVLAVDPIDELRDAVEVHQVVGDQLDVRAVAIQRRAGLGEAVRVAGDEDQRRDIGLAAHPDRRGTSDALAGTRDDADLAHRQPPRPMTSA